MADYTQYESRLRKRLRADDIEGALAVLGEAVAEDDLEVSAAGRERRARLYFRLGRLDEALDDVDYLMAREGKITSQRLVGALLTGARITSQAGEYTDAISSLERAVDLVQSDEVEAATTAAAHIELAAVLNRIGQHERGEEQIRLAEEAAERLEGAATSKKEKILAWISIQRGLAAFRRRDLEEAKGFYQRALELLKKRRSLTLLEGDVQRYLGAVASMQGDNRLSLRHHRQALEIYLKLHAPLGQAKIYNSLGQTCLALSRLDEARFFMHKAEEISRKIGAESESATVYGKLGMIYAELADYEKAIEYQLRDVDSCRRFGNYRALAFAMRNLGLSYRGKGELEEAIEYLEESLVRFQELSDTPHIARVYLELGHCFLDSQRLPEAEEALEEGIQILEEEGRVGPDLGFSRLLMGVLHRHWQNYHVSEGSLLAALKILEESGHFTHLAQTYYELARLNADRGKESEAVRYVKQAFGLAKKLEMRELMMESINLMERLSSFGLVDLLVEELWQPAGHA